MTSLGLRAVDVLSNLGRRPWSLAILMLLLDAIVLPYRGFEHDAELYAAQVTNRVTDKGLSEDLFFRHGSQDQYSLFSILMVIPTRLIGLEAAFLVVYLISKAILFWSMARLAIRVTSAPVAATLTAMFLSVSFLRYGGFGVFQVNEAFLTPRLLAIAAVLLGLERLFSGRLLWATVLMACAAVLHPIMALCGVGVLILWVAVRYLPMRGFMSLCAFGVACLGLLAIAPSLGTLLFGRMDAEWLTFIHRATPYTFLTEWLSEDWLILACSTILIVSSSYRLRHSRPEVARLGWMALAIAVVGVTATAIASVRGYTLLFQAQPYRALYLIVVLQVPLAIDWAVSQWRTSPERRWVCIVPLGLLLAQIGPSLWSLALVALVFPVIAIAVRGLERVPRSPNWQGRSFAIAVLTGFIAWNLFSISVLVTSSEDVLDTYRQAAPRLGPLFWGLIGVAILSLLRPDYRFGIRYFMIVSLVWIGVQVSVYQRLHSVDPSAHFVSNYLHEKGRSGAVVYWPPDHAQEIWFTSKTMSFFSGSHTAGAIFNRGTAVEVVRRGERVRSFELHLINQAATKNKPLPELRRRWLEGFYGARVDEVSPSRDDLLMLCQEPELDFIVVPYRFDGFDAATDGLVYIYDCRQIRRKMPSHDLSSESVLHSDRPHSPLDSEVP